MIGRLSGQILAKHPPLLLLDVQGVGYEVEAPMSTFYDLPPVGEKTTLYTHLSIREDAHVLYGFVREPDRTLFRALLKVNGVGGKMALAILSGMSAGEFAACVQAGDLAALTRVPGVGKKTAERLVVEMRDRLQHFPAAGGISATGASVGISGDDGAMSEAASALVSLGYKAADASRMVKAVVDVEQMTSEQIIRAALRAIAPKG